MGSLALFPPRRAPLTSPRRRTQRIAGGPIPRPFKPRCSPPNPSRGIPLFPYPAWRRALTLPFPPPQPPYAAASCERREVTCFAGGRRRDKMAGCGGSLCCCCPQCCGERESRTPEELVRLRSPACVRPLTPRLCFVAKPQVAECLRAGGRWVLPWRWALGASARLTVACCAALPAAEL